MANGNNHVTPPDVERELERRNYFKFQEPPPPPDPVIDDHHVVIPIPDPIIDDGDGDEPIPPIPDPIIDDGDGDEPIPPIPDPIIDDGEDWIHEPFPVPLPDARRELIAGAIYAAFCMFVSEDQILLPYH